MMTIDEVMEMMKSKEGRRDLIGIMYKQGEAKVRAMVECTVCNETYNLKFNQNTNELSCGNCHAKIDYEFIDGKAVNKEDEGDE